MATNVSASNLKRGEGAYRVALQSGLLTAVAAATATAGYLWAFRFAPAAGVQPAPKFAVITRLRAKLQTISGFTAAQEVGIDLSVARVFTAFVTGGTSAVLTTNNGKKIDLPANAGTTPPSSSSAMMIGTTVALTAGTQTLDAQPVAIEPHAEGAVATAQPGASQIVMDTGDLLEYPIALATNEGLIIRNTTLMGAAGTARLVVELDWLELFRIA